MYKWWPLVAICLGAFMLLVDITIVTVALPKMAAGLKSSFADLQWVMDAYALTLAALLLIIGSVADVIGRRTVYVAGLLLFAVASLVCGLAPNPGVLIAARAVQGIGGAAVYASSAALLNSIYQGRDRGVAFGAWGAINSVAAAAGPLLGGLLTEHVGWRAIFLVNLPVCVLAVAMTFRVITESRSVRTTTPPGEPPGGHGGFRGVAPRVSTDRTRVDLGGGVTFTVAAGSLTLGLIRGPESGWAAASTVVSLCVAALALAAFIVIESRVAAPMLDLGLFRRPAFTGLMIGCLTLAAGAFATIPFTSLWLQSSVRLSPVGTGLVLVTAAASSFVASSLAGRILHRAQARLTIGGGLLLIAAGTVAMAVLTFDSGWVALLPGMIVYGAGIGLCSTSLAAAVMGSVPPEHGGMASGAMNTFRQLGFALGIALLGVVYQTGTGGRGGLNSTYLVAAALAALGGVVVLALVRAKRTPEVPAQKQVREQVPVADGK